MGQTFLRQCGEGDWLGVGDLGGLVLMGDEHKVHSVGGVRLQVTKVHLVIVMVEELTELGDLKMKRNWYSFYCVLFFFYPV